MTWTPDVPSPAVAWSRDPSSAVAWPPDQPPFADWGVQRGGSSTRRIIEGAPRKRRVTEQGNVRIIERFKVTWNLAPPPSGGWTPT